MLEEYMENVRKRCVENKLDPSIIPTFGQLAASELANIQADYKVYMEVIFPFLEKFLKKSGGIPMLVSITDDQGNIIEYIGDPSLEDTVVNVVGLKKGVMFSEEQAGVNSVFAALKLGIPVQVIGEEHFYHFLHQSACYSVPLFHQNRVIGTISIMTFLDVANPLIMASLETVVDSIQRELELLEQNRYLDEMNYMVLEKSNTGYIVMDDAGKLVKINPRAIHVLGYPVDSDLRNLDGLHELNEIYKRHLSGETIYAYKIRLRNEKEIVTCLVDFFPFQEGTLIQLHDITEYIKTESYIQNAEKLAIVGQLAAGVAHEIKNPLTTLKGFIQMMGKQAGGNGLYADIMLKEIERINQITNEFLVLSRPTVQQKEWLDPCALIKEVDVLLSSFAMLKNVEISYKFEEVSPFFLDGNQMKQVFINLVKNSVDAMEKNGQLMISVQGYHTDQLLIRFSDDGKGFPSHILKGMGQPFLTTKKHGNGLGLMVCKRIVESIHHGELRIQNGNDKGAVVDIIIPGEHQA